LDQEHREAPKLKEAQVAVTGLQGQIAEVAVFMAVEEMGRMGVEILLAMDRRAQYASYGLGIRDYFHQQIQVMCNGIIYPH